MALPLRMATMPPLLMRRILRPTLHNYERSTLIRAFPQRPFIRSVVTTPEVNQFPPPPPPRTSFLRRVFEFTFRAILFSTAGYYMAATLSTAESTARTDAETLTKWAPSSPAEQAHEDFLNAHPFVQGLRANPAYSESRPHMKIPAGWRPHNLTAGTLMGENRVPFPPLAWIDVTSETKDYVQISYVGQELCGHPGIVHGGYLATVLDEGLARASFAALPNKIGLTASLTVNYKAPCKAGQYIVLRGQVTKAEGRKAWVDGRIETLPEAGEEPVVLATATALYIEPREAKMLSKVYAPE